MDAPASNPATENGLGFLNLMVVALSLYVLIALIADTFFQLDPEVSRLLALVDDLVCIFFLYDFAIRFYRAERKLEFLKWGWIDLLSSIPTLEYFRPGRAIRLLRLFRILRAYRSVRIILNHLFERRVKGTLSSVAVFAVLMLIFSSIAILQVEDDPNSNIKTAEDALWWAYVTITTVGYGDRYPVTSEGRLIAAALMTTGVGLFGTFTALIASWFVADDAKDRDAAQ